ncbi:hypothetical protein [Microbacterium sp. SLBN-111]|uniref:hypothetical protein n=1 Tax=Microbacterium sp. SLBN-111 TaxID=3377733 RepID=UPI003C76C504
MSEQTWQGFGFGEIGFLLIQDDLPAVKKAREVFDLVDHAYADDVAVASMSSLIAHGLLEIDSDGVPQPRGAATVLSYAVAEATRWTRIGFFSGSDEAIDGAVLLHAPALTAILQPRQGGSWLMLAKAPEVSDGEALWALVSGFRDGHEAASTFVEVSTVGGRATLFADRAGAVSWTLALGESALWPEQRRTDVDDNALRELLNALVVDDLAAPESV